MLRAADVWALLEAAAAAPHGLGQLRTQLQGATVASVGGSAVCGNGVCETGGPCEADELLELIIAGEDHAVHSRK